MGREWNDEEFNRDHWDWEAVRHRPSRDQSDSSSRVPSGTQPTPADRSDPGAHTAIVSTVKSDFAVGSTRSRVWGPKFT